MGRSLRQNGAVQLTSGVPLSFPARLKAVGRNRCGGGWQRTEEGDPKASPESAWVGARVHHGAWGWGLKGTAKDHFVPPPHAILGMWLSGENTYPVAFPEPQPTRTCFLHPYPRVRKTWDPFRLGVL